MTKYISGDVIQDVDPVNEAAFEAVGWRRVEEPEPPKSDKASKSN